MKVHNDEGFEIIETPSEVNYQYDDDTPYVYVCTPAYDNKVDTDYAQSIANALWHAFPFGVHASVSMLANSAFIDLARNLFVSFFLNDPDLKDCTHLMFIDSDLKFDPKAFVGVVKACREDMPVVAGVYPRRQSTLDFPCLLEPHPEILEKEGREALWVDNDDAPRFVKAKRVPTGFLCIRRNILEEMAEDAPKLTVHGQEWPVPKVFYTDYITEDGHTKMIGEDFKWCDDYRERYGRPIDVAFNLDFVHGGWKGNFADYLEDLQRKNRKLGARRDKKVDVRKAV